MPQSHRLSWLPLVASLAAAATLSAPIVRADDLLANESDGTTIVSEAGSSDTFMFQLDSQPSADVTVAVRAIDGTEVRVSPASLVFTSTNWNTPQSVTVTGVDDSLADGNQTTTIRLESSSGDNGFNGLLKTLNVVTTDNETSSQMIIHSGADTRVSESGSTDFFDILLPTKPAANVMVAIRSENAAEVDFSPMGLQFTPENWNTGQRITVRGIDDSLNDGNKTVGIFLDFTSSDPAFDNSSIRVDVVSEDNEPPAATARPSITSPAEGAKIAGLSTMVTWENPTGTTQYQIQVIPMNNDGPGINLIRNAETSYVIEDPDFGADEPNYVLLPDMTYTVRIRTTSSMGMGDDLAEGDWSSWSEPRHFETGNVSSATISLENPTGLGSLRPTLHWGNSNDDVFYYEVQVSRDRNFCATAGCPMLYWELRHGGMSEPLNSYQIPAAFPLEADTTYHWRVRPRIQGDGTPVAWSSSASFHATGGDATGGARGGVIRGDISLPR